MKISHGRQRKVGIALTYIQMAFNILVNIVCTPIILNKLGQSEYGLYNLTSSIINYLSLLTLGFGASYIRFYSRYKSENDEEGIHKLNGLYMIVFMILGLIALIGGLVLSFNSKILFNSTYSSNDLKIAKILMLLLTFNMAVSFPMSVYTAIISSQERFIFQKLVNIGKTVIAPVVSIAVIFFGLGSIGMVVVTTVITLIIDFLNIFYCHKKLKTKFKFGKIDGKLLKEIAVFSIFIAINQLIDQLNTQTDKVILGKIINASAVAIYAIAATIQGMYLHFSTAVNTVFAPKIHRIINSGEKDTDSQLTDLFIRIGRVQYFILMLIMTGFIFFGQYFIKLWVGSGFEIVYYLVLILMIPSTVPLIQNIGIEIQRAKNKHQFRSLVYLLVAIINVVISIVLCKFYGIIGVTIGTAFANIVGCIIIMNIYYHKKIGINIIKFWKSILRASIGFIIPVVAGVLIMKFIYFNNILIYLIFLAFYSILYLVSIYLFGMNQEEKMFIKKILKKVRNLFKAIVIFIVKVLKKLGVSSGKCDVLIYSHYTTMDSHVMQFYKSIKDENLKIKFIFFDVSKVNKTKYTNFGLEKKDVLFSKTKYLFLKPKVIIFANLNPMAQEVFNSKFVYVNHGSGTLASGETGIPYSYKNNKKYYDVYFETNNIVVENFDGNQNVVGKLKFSGNKFNDEYKQKLSKRDEYREKYGILPKQKVVFICGSWNIKSLFHIIGMEGIETIKKLAQDKKYKIIVSIHPNEYRQYESNVKPLGPEIDKLEEFGVIVRKPSEDFIPFIVMSDLVISDFSSMGDHALMMGKPICYSEFEDDMIFDYACCKLLKDKVPFFDNNEDFEKCITENYPKESLKEIEKVRKSMDTPIGFWDELCKNTVRELMEKKNG